MSIVGRRIVRPKQRRPESSHLHWLRSAAKVRIDVVAQQVLDHDDGIFGAVRANDADAALRLIAADENCLALRDSVGQLLAFASLTYTSNNLYEPSPYEGENILHIAIIHRQTELVLWLVREAPQLVRAETTGKFFGPTKACYFGGTPLLFALSSNQIDMALHILEAAERLQDGPFKEDEGEDWRPFSRVIVIRDFPSLRCRAAVRHEALSPTEKQLTPIKVGPAMYEEKPGMRRMRSSAPTEESFAPSIDYRQGEINLVEFLQGTSDSGYEKMFRFLMQRNSDELTPLSLAAAIGQQRMFQHLFNHSSSVAWRFGPITAIHVPLFDLEQPELRLLQILDIFNTFTTSSPPKGRKGYRTAIQCLCSTEKISNTLQNHHKVLREVVAKRLEMLKMVEIEQLLHKKWKYVGRQRFLWRLAIYCVFLVLLNATTLAPYSKYTDGSRGEVAGLGFAEVGALVLAALKFLNESNQMLLNSQGYITEGGAGRLDNICTTVTSISLFASSAARLAHQQEVGDALGAVALIFSWFYMFFFLLGFRTTGPFVIMILRMIAHDIVRFFLVYSAVLVGFSQAIYVVHDGRVGRTRSL
ncbi:Ankyrin repeat-containing domain [Phytophthora cactorum]|nr:Ankyrin repeat-containing domain [Phytophthora cactorum]